MQKNIVNTLIVEVEENSWLRKKLPFQNILSNVLLDFPEVTLIDLQIFFQDLTNLNNSFHIWLKCLMTKDC